MKKNFTFHLIGICGISMSSLAVFLNKLNFEVSGSDCSFCKNQNILGDRVLIFNTHKFTNVPKNAIVIYSSAISKDNLELDYALKNNLCFSRVEFLKIISNFFKLKIGVSGCHGKTTTTCILANMLRYEKIYTNIGGEDKNLTNSYFKGNDIFLSEVCEYKKNINLFTSDIAVVLNIDFDHVECYRDIKELQNAYYNYLNRAKIRIINNDDKLLRSY